SASTATFLTALVFNAIVFAVEIGAFTVLRPYFRAVYEPRTYVPPPSKRATPISDGFKSSKTPNSALSRTTTTVVASAYTFFRWPLVVLHADYNDAIRTNGMDAYFFLRYLRMMTVIFFPIWIISWIILLPVTAAGESEAGTDGLDRLDFGNVQPNKQLRYIAHIILVYLFTVWIFYVIRRELSHFIVKRQQYLISPKHANTVQANTILVTGIPTKYLDYKLLFDLFKDLPGGVKTIWINRDLRELPDVYDRQLNACSKLESAETALLKTAMKAIAADAKAKAKAEGKEQSAADLEAGVRAGTLDLEALVPQDERPTHKLGFLGLFGEKVDTIQWARKEIAETRELLAAGRASIEASTLKETRDAPDIAGAATGDESGTGEITMAAPVSDESPSEDVQQQQRSGGAFAAIGVVAGKGKNVAAKGVGVAGRLVGVKDDNPTKEYPLQNSAFITFNKQIAAQLAAQVLLHHAPYRMTDVYIEMAPGDVIWANLNLNPYEQKVRILISYAITAALIIFWALPVAFIGIISNIYTVCSAVSWLNWICNLPSVVVGIISGILPPVLLAVLMMLLPIVLRLLARFEGIPKYTGLELSLMSRFYIFVIVHSFLIVAVSSGIIPAINQIVNDPTSIPTLLAEKLPLSSIFFLTYVLLQGLSGVAGGFLNIVSLIIYYAKLYILGSTPRAVYGIKYSLGSVTWGTTFPGIGLITAIALGYSIISPIINGLACFTFAGFYFLYKYLFLWQYQQATDTGGLFFPKAIQHIFVGLYVQQVVLCALFFLARDQNNKASAIPEGALMIVLIILTICFHLLMNGSYGPLINALPLTLKNKTYGYNEAQGSTPESAGRAFTRDSDDQSPADEADASIKMKDYVSARNTSLGSAANNERSDDDAPLRAAAVHRPPPAEDEYGFAHPAASRPQPTIWIPRDEYGLYRAEEQACLDESVDASSEGAEMSKSGKVDISAPPPDLYRE
ncbi:DUF221-domain-containing protein, partial [Fistulina hepatica ATCC 64428]